MADPLDYTLVRMDDSIPDDAVLSYDAVNDKIVDSGLTAKYGELQAGADSVAVGLQTMSSAGEQVVWENQHTSVVYAPPWHIVDEINTEGSRDRIYGPLQETVVFSDKSGTVSNPTNTIDVPEDGIVFSYTITFPDARTGVELLITYLDPNDPTLTEPPKALWREIRDVSAGENVISLTLPNALYTGQYYFTIRPIDSSEPPIVVVGNPQTGEFAYNTKFRSFREIPLATQEYVADYVQTHGGSTGNGDMLKSVYDTNDNGKVDKAEQADNAIEVVGVNTAGVNSYYGTNLSGDVGFHPVHLGSSDANKVIVNEFTVSSALKGGLFQPGPTFCFVYTGTGTATLTLPNIATFSQGSDVQFYVVNHAKDDSHVTINLNSNDGWNGDSSVGSIVLAKNAGYAIASDTSESMWYALASLDTSSNADTAKAIADMQKQIVANATAIARHTTSIEAHGSQIATFGGLIQGNARKLSVLEPLVNQNTNEIDTVRRNAVEHITASVNTPSKTVTFNLMSKTGLVDSVLINLAPMFGGHQVDSTLYYGFSDKGSFSEADILSGNTKDVPNIVGLDITMTRSTQDPQFMWIWIPDDLGTVKGFNFSGFISQWNSVQLHVANVPGKLYKSPNRTSAQNVTYEVTV